MGEWKCLEWKSEEKCTREPAQAWAISVSDKPWAADPTLLSIAADKYMPVHVALCIITEAACAPSRKR